MHACRSRFQLKTRRSTPHCAVRQIATVLHCMAPKRRLSGSCVGSDPWETLFKDHWKQCTDNGLPPWELGPYGHLDYNSTVDPLGLLQCQALLRLLFTHCPTGIVNHLALRGPLQNIATQCKGVDRTDEWWSDWIASKLRIAMAHVRRLKLLPKVYTQRVRGLTAGQKATLDETMALYHPTEKPKPMQPEPRRPVAVALQQQRSLLALQQQHSLPELQHRLPLAQQQQQSPTLPVAPTQTRQCPLSLPHGGGSPASRALTPRLHTAPPQTSSLPRTCSKS